VRCEKPHPLYPPLSIKWRGVHPEGNQGGKVDINVKKNCNLMKGYLLGLISQYLYIVDVEPKTERR